MINNTRAPLYPEPETVPSLYFLHSAPHQIHVGSLGSCFWAEMNKSAIFFVFTFFVAATRSPTSGKQKLRS